MNNLYFNLSSITENTTIKRDEVVFKGRPTIQYVLTGIDEESNKALSLELTWGDGSMVEYYSKDVFFNYREDSIFNEMLYNKPGGSVCYTYNHTYNPPISTTSTSLTSQLIIYFNNGTYVNFYQPIKLVKESYYDEIQEFSILNTQIQSTSSLTVANLESKNSKTFITILE